jgi:hypothetical protein
MVHRVTLTPGETFSRTSNEGWIIKGVVGGGDTVTLVGNGDDTVDTHLTTSGSTITITGAGNDVIKTGNVNSNTITLTDAGTSKDTVYAGAGSSNTITATSEGAILIDDIGHSDTISMSGRGHNRINIGNGSKDTITENGVGVALDTINAGLGANSTFDIDSISKAVDLRVGENANSIYLRAGHTGLDSIIYLARAGGAPITVAAGGALSPAVHVYDRSATTTALKINVHLITARGAHAVATGFHGDWHMGHDTVFVEKGPFSYVGTPTAENVAKALGAVTSSAGDIGVVALQTAAGSGIYDLFRVDSVHAHSHSPLAHTDTVELVGTYTLGVGHFLTAHNFIA